MTKLADPCLNPKTSSNSRIDMAARCIRRIVDAEHYPNATGQGAERIPRDGRTNADDGEDERAKELGKDNPQAL